MRPRSDINPAPLGIMFLGMAALVFLMVSRDRSESRDELRIERRRRHELEDRLRTREEQLDNALGHIGRQANGGNGGHDEPEPEPGPET